MKKLYQNYEDYSQNDPDFLVRVLKEEVHKPQKKINFLDGTTYHVTKSGSRYWQKNDSMHRETGPASSYSYGNTVYSNYYLFGIPFATRELHEAGVARLNFLREQSDGQLEFLMDIVSQSSNWESKRNLWGTILTGSNDSTAMITQLEKIAKENAKLDRMTRNFVDKFGKFTFE
jgi:hypothetical protein